MLEANVQGLPHTSSEAAASARPRLWLGAGSRLWLEYGSERSPVRPVRCFPWSSPDSLVSLRDADDRELFLVETLDALDAASATALREAMQSAGFVLVVDAIESIEEDYEVRVWRARTRHGKRTFQTRLDEWPWEAPDGGYLIRDLCGDLFRLPPLETLDPETRRWLWAYVG
jgi:hypothetical protein